MMIFKHQFLLVFVFVLLEEVISTGKSKKTKSSQNNNQFRRYTIHQSDSLPSDVQVTTYLYKDQPKTFSYWSFVDNGSLSAIVMTCSSEVTWTMYYHGKNNLSVVESQHVETVVEKTKDTSTKHFISLTGLYVLNVTSLERNTFVHIYISTEDGGPQALKSTFQNNLKFLKGQRKGQLTVKWEASLVDPQGTDYCLVVNTEKHYKTMCSAEAPISEKIHTSWELKSESDRTYDKSCPIIHCVGRKTRHKLSNIKQNLTYNFDLFAINNQSNFTYLLNSATKRFNEQTKLITLHDGKSRFANLRKMGGKATFKFKVGKNSGKILYVCIMPCGSEVYVDITLKGTPLVNQQRIEKFKNITIRDLGKGSRYIIRVVSTNEDFVNTGVEVFVTTKPSSKSPLPQLPRDPTVKEYESLRRCDSVTIAWLPSPGAKTINYCLIVKEGNIKEGYSQANQCGLENRLRKSMEFALKYCMEVEHGNKAVITEKINHLKPGRSYIVLVTVKKPKGKTLFYNLLQVSTPSSCENDLYNE